MSSLSCLCLCVHPLYKCCSEWDQKSPVPQGSADLRVAKNCSSAVAMLYWPTSWLWLPMSLFKKYFIHLFIWQHRVLSVAQKIFAVSRGIFRCGELASCGMQAYLLRSIGVLISPIRDRTCIPCIVRWVLHHWTTREVPQCYSLITWYLQIQCKAVKKHLRVKQDLIVYSNSVTLRSESDKGKGFYFLNLSFLIYKVRTRYIFLQWRVLKGNSLMLKIRSIQTHKHTCLWVLILMLIPGMPRK